jgi:hypothetical protein
VPQPRRIRRMHPRALMRPVPARHSSWRAPFRGILRR